ncbi:MAG: hypothetical protein GF417_12690 [Candidatus Latescibacteria bacterium]|nr:hypothetical protein [bacterium]MBD3425286.1 hypothetical protein [Candidatus Latescibacterota bacterium]
MWKYLAGWIPMVPIAILNAAIREKFLAGQLSELASHQVSTVTAVILLGLYIFLLTGRVRIESGRMALRIGLIWLGLTLSFEFLFGHYIMGNPWNRLLHDYNITAGRVWLFIPAWTALAPYIFYRLRERSG